MNQQPAPSSPQSGGLTVFWKMTLPIVGLVLAGMAALAVYVPHMLEADAHNEAGRTATEVAGQFLALRGYYTQNVVGKVVAGGAHKASTGHKQDPDAIPLPATMIHELSDLYKDMGITLQLYSAFPFPYRKERKLDAFQERAWKTLASHPDAKITALETREGRTVVRTAVADIMSAQTCIDCHNAHPDSPRRDWKLGELRGILEVRKVIDTQLAENGASARRVVVAIGIFMALCLGMLLVLFRMHVGRPHAALKARNEQAALLTAMTRVLQVAENVNEAGMLVAKYLPQALPESTGGAIYLLRASRDCLELLAQWGDAQAAAHFQPNQCWGLRLGQPHGIGDGPVNLHCGHLPPERVLDGHLCMPLIAQGEALGVLVLDHDAAHGTDFAEARGRAIHVAEHLSLALANVRLRDDLREQSVRDPLTGLYNRRYLEESFMHELARAERDRKPVAVFMLDVDHFKRYNDTHGHEAGDAVLRALGRTMTESSRLCDIVCRYGGEEFTVVLHDTAEDEARAWSERMMGRVRAMEIRSNGQPLPAVTISMGLALYPDHGSTPSSMLQAADAALYEAKHAGRDRLKVVEVARVEALASRIAAA